MKKKISIFLIISMLIVTFSVPVYALELPDHDFRNDGLNKYWKVLQDIGFITTYPAYSAGRSLGQVVKKYLQSKNDPDANNINSDEDGGAWINNGVSVQNGDLVLSNTVNNLIKYSIDDYISESGVAYVQEFDLYFMATDFNNATYYNALCEFCRQYQEQYYICKFINTQDANKNTLVLVPQNKYGFLASATGNANAQQVYQWSFTNWQNGIDSGDFRSFAWDSNTNTFVEGTPFLNYTVGWSQVKFSSENHINETTPAWICYRKTIYMPLFGSLDALKSYSVGQKPYYYNNQTYTNWSNSSGDYTLDSSNSNNITYGDITTYIDNNTENGNIPTPTQIQIFIENNIPEVNPTPTPTPTPVPDNPSGGGGSSGETNIFDFLSNLGSVLGNLIKNLGQALTELIEGISEVISGLIESIPVVFNDFLGAVIGWMPTELRALLSLFISAMVIVGLIRLFKG